MPMSENEIFVAMKKATIDDISDTVLAIHPEHQRQFLKDLQSEINKLLEMYPEEEGEKPDTFNGTCEGCGMGFIRCTFELCPDCKSPIIPDPEEEGQ